MRLLHVRSDRGPRGHRAKRPICGFLTPGDQNTGSAKARRDFCTRRWSCLGGQRLCGGGILARHYRESPRQRDLGRLGECDVPRRAAGRCRARRMRRPRFCKKPCRGDKGSAGRRRGEWRFTAKAFRRPDFRAAWHGLAVRKGSRLLANDRPRSIKLSPRSRPKLFAVTRAVPQIIPACTAPVDLANDGDSWPLERGAAVSTEYVPQSKAH